MVTRRKRRYQETTFEGVVNNPPAFRPEGQRPAEAAQAAGSAYKKHAKDLTEVQAWQYFDDGLKSVIRDYILDARKHEKDIQIVKRDLLKSTKVLDNVYANATRIHDLHSYAVSTKLRGKGTLKRQHEYINNNYDKIAKEKESFPTIIPKAKKDMPGAPAGRKQKTTTYPASDVRTVTTTYSSIIRKDGITEDMSQHFQQMFNAATEEVSNHIVDYGVQVLRYITMFKTHTFELRGGVAQFVRARAPFTLADVLPEAMFDAATLQGPLPPPLNRDFLEDEDQQQPARTFLSEPHLERIYITYFGGRAPSAATLAKYPLHRAVSAVLPRPAVVPRIRFYHAKSVARTTFKTNFENLWNLKRRFTNAFNRIITVLLRFHLAPQRETERQLYLKSKREDQDDGTPDPEQTANGRISFAGKTTNQIRRIFSRQRRDQQKYTNKAKETGDARWVRKAKGCADRLARFTAARYPERRPGPTHRPMTTAANDNTEAELEVLSQTNPAASSQLDELQDSQDAENGDLSARAIRELVATIRNVIFARRAQQDPVTEEEFQESTENGITGDKLRVCLNIVNRLMPYVPSRENWFSKLHQIPFILLVNEIFRATGYASHALKLTNLPSTSTLMALTLDVEGVYNTFSVRQGDRPVLNLFTYDGRIITDDSIARSNQDAVFHSLFDLERIANILAPYHLQFRQQLTLLPGLKTVRILGSKTRDPTLTHAALLSTDQKAPSPSTKKSAPSKQAPPSEEPTDAERREIKRQIRLRKVEAEALARQLKQTMRDRATFLTTQYRRINKLKAGFPSREPQQQQEEQPQRQDFPLTRIAIRDTMHQQIQDLKLRRDHFNQQVVTMKRDLARQRMILYRLRKGISIEPPEEPAQLTPTIRITADRYLCYEKAENVRLDPALHQSPNMRFSGTDNGIVTMTETSRFDMQRFRFHLKLANTFESLKGLNDEDGTSRYKKDMPQVEQQISANPDLLRLPKPHKMHATDIDFKTGAKKQRARLYRAKHSPEGQRVVEAEAIFSQNSLHNAQDLEQINARYEAQLGQRDVIRRFYYTSTKAKQKRQYEYTKRKQIDRLCSEERKYVKSDGEKYVKARDGNNQTILFIGDRGTGVGSRIKGHLRYGGHWKSNKHSLNTSVCITNEFNSSQTCAFCFEKITHPVKMVQGHLKTINGTSVCSNPRCLLVKKKRSHQPRDSQSALLIGLSGLCTVLSATTTFPALNPRNQNISQVNTDFQTFAGTFL